MPLIIIRSLPTLGCNNHYRPDDQCQQPWQGGNNDTFGTVKVSPCGNRCIAKRDIHGANRGAVVANADQGWLSGSFKNPLRLLRSAAFGKKLVVLNTAFK